MSSTAEPAELLPGYHVDEATGAWITLNWPKDPLDLPPSLGPQLIRALEGTDDYPGLIDYLAPDESPWRFTVTQRRWLYLWYAVMPTEDSNGARWLFRSGVKRGSKGTGKDPLCASMCHGELWGPAKFASWDGDESPPFKGWKGPWPTGVAHRLPVVQIGANSEAQAADVLRVANAMVGADLAYELDGWDPGILRSQLRTGGRIELLTFSERSSEGDPATAVFLNETHHMTHSSGGQKLAAVGRRNVAKSPGGNARLAEFTNAHQPGEESVAEDSFDAWQTQAGGRARRQDILYDSREADPSLRLEVEEELEKGIAQAYSDSPWTDQTRIRDDAQDLRTTAADAIRYYLNGLPTSEDAWVDPRKLDAAAARGSGLTVEDGEPIALFLDCSKSSDATVLAASRISDGHVMALGGWQKPHGDRGKGWLAPREQVDAAVLAARDRFDVQWFGVDPSPAKDEETEAQYWAGHIDRWHAEFRDSVLLWATPGKTTGHAVLFDMRLSSKGGVGRNQLFTEQAERTVQDIEEDETFTWDGDPMMKVHFLNARRRPNQWGVALGKKSRSSSKLVDYAVGAVGARLGRRLILNSGLTRESKKKPGSLW